MRAEGFLIALVAAVAGAVAARLPLGITQDTWLALLSGRLILHDGIPHHDPLTVWSLGHAWVDQQWLAHLAFYALDAAGGLLLVGLVGVAAAAGALGAAVTYVRRRGTTGRTTAWLVAACGYSILLGAANVRTQVLVLPLFVAVLALLLDDANRPTPRVFLTLPLLLLWANLHGSVTVGAALVALRAFVGLRTRALRRRSLALAAGALVAALATPYGFEIIDYYHRTLLDSGMRLLVTEWRPPAFGIVTAPIILLALGALWLTARHTRRLNAFHILAQLLLVALMFSAVRNAVWLGLGSLMLLAPALDAELGAREFEPRRMNARLAIVGVAFLLNAVVSVASRGSSTLTQQFPARAGDAIAAAALRDPSAKIFADDRFADWLMFEHPQLVGRVVYDIRYEQLTYDQLLAIGEWKNQVTDHWRAAARDAGVIVVNLPTGEDVARAYRRNGATRERYVDSRVAVFVRS